MKSMKWLVSNILVVLILMATDISAAPQTLDKVVAVVDDDVIMASELGLQMHMIESQLQQANKPIPPLEVMQKQVLEKLIVESLQVQLGERAGIKVTDEQLQAALTDIAAQNRVSIESLQHEVEKQGIPFGMFRNNVRKEIIVQQVQQALVNKRIEISDQDVDTFLKSEEGRIAASQQAGDKLMPQSHTRHILIKTSAVRNDDESKALLQSIRAKIAQGEDFGDLAKNYSEDPGSALKGGDLGWVMQGQMVPQFEEVMNGMDLQYVSAPFRTQYGWHILQVLERRQQNMSDEILKKQAQIFLRKRQYQDELPRWLKELRDKAYVKIKL
jgi:peptidyl-prolyl cis-trans isomerase SurA